MKHEFVPAACNSRLDHVGSYRRRLPVSLERMYENALDWQHLPHLHSSSFGSIHCVIAGGWGWQATVSSGGGDDEIVSELELRLDRDARRWVTRNLSGPNAGAEIWTHVFVVADRVLDIVVDFFVPNVPAEAREKVGQAYARAYEVLYDEDVDMMTGRQNQLDLRLDGFDESEVLKLSPHTQGSLPVSVTMSGRRFVVNRLEGEGSKDNEWVVYPAQCPHQLGPLDEMPMKEGTVRCPWHGYVFDVRTGECVSGSHCRLGRVPRVLESEGGVELRWL